MGKSVSVTSHGVPGFTEGEGWESRGPVVVSDFWTYSDDYFGIDLQQFRTIVRYLCLLL